jgi:hypothetical protein
MLHRIFLFAHVLFAFLYMIAHGGSVAVAYRVRRETSAERVHALLDLSRSTAAVAGYMLTAMIACGVVLGFLGRWWSSRWIWLSIATLVAVFVVMGRLAVPHFRGIRQTLGLVLVDGTWQRAEREPSPDALARALGSGRPTMVTGLAIGGWALILWLMLFKPF